MKKNGLYVVGFLVFGVLIQGSYAQEPMVTRIKATLTPEDASKEIEVIHQNIQKDYPGCIPARQDFRFPDFSVSVLNWRHFGGTDFFVGVFDKEGTLIYQKKVGRKVTSPAETDDISIHKLQHGVLIAYNNRVIRGAGAAWQWAELLFLDYFSKEKESSLTIPGKHELGGWGDPRSAYNFFMGQTPSLEIQDDKISVRYQFRHWKDTSRYRDDRFRSEVPPDEAGSKTMIIGLNDRTELEISPKSETTTGALNEYLDLRILARYRNLPWIEIIHY